MSAHHFLTNSRALPPIGPSQRWSSAFSSGQCWDWDGLSTHAHEGDVVWISVLHADWKDKISALVQGAVPLYVVVLSPLPYDAEGLRAIHLGAHGYCHLYAVPELMQEVGRAVQTGALWVGPELVGRIASATRTLLHQHSQNAAVVPSVDLSVLSARELQVARAVADGKSNKEVASQLYISERTVKAHLGAVFEKLAVRDRVQLVLRMSSVSEPEVQAYLNDLHEDGNVMSRTDADLARVTEDLVDLLIQRGVIKFTDLPDAAQAKLLLRKQARATLTQGLRLIPEDGDHGTI